MNAMNRQVWAALAVLAAFMLGGLIQRVVFEAPRTDLAMAKVADQWRLPGSDAPWSAATDSTWRAGRPLGAAPPPPKPPAPPPPPPPPTAVPAGVVANGSKGLEAVFFDPVAGEVHLKRGQVLPSGGRVVRVEPNLVEWTNAKGQRFRHVMLFDPAPFTTYTNGIAPGGYPVGPPPALPPPINSKKP